MIRIRAIHSAATPFSRARLDQAKEIFRASFPALADYADGLEGFLENPFTKGYKAVVLVAETNLGLVLGFSLVLHFPEIAATWLDFIAVRRKGRGQGFGGALYEAAREYCQGVGSRGLYLEVEPDDPEITPDPDELAVARRRMRFYEQYDARVVLNSAYAQPVGTPPTTAYLLFDGLGRTDPLARDEARIAVGQILERRFAHSTDPAYIAAVVADFRDDPVAFRPKRYLPKAPARPVQPGRLEKPFAIVSSPRHVIHHVRQRGYLERPARVSAITEALEPLGIFDSLPARRFPLDAIYAVHERHFVDYLKEVCLKLSKDRPVYPDTFPIRRPDRRPKVRPVQAGFYCIDSCTPLDGNAYEAARRSVDVALTAAEELLIGRRVAYAVCRPPGHHAERRVYGGFCYFNNAAIAAHRLAADAKVALLDIDFHHGNGTQDIFYDRADVLTLSIHGHPDDAFPYFSGFPDETGTGSGLGFNANFALPAGTGHDAYLKAFEKATARLDRFRPEILIVSLGFDVLRGDPTGTFALTPDTLDLIAQRLARFACPLLIVQEGGYNLRNLRRGARAFFAALAATCFT